MKPFKMAAMSIVAGAGLALFGAPAFAQNTAYTTADTNAGISSGSSESSSSVAAQGTQGQGTTSSSTITGGDITLGGTTSSNNGNGEDNPDSSFQFAATRSHESSWHKQASGASSTSGGSGESMAAVFVMEQGIVLNKDALLQNDSGAPDTATISSSFGTTAINGVALVNQSAGLGNQQGNLFATIAELSGSSFGPNSGSNAINVTNAQDLVLSDATVQNEEYVHPRTLVCEADGEGCIRSNTAPTGDTATITGSFTTVNGAVGVNQTVGLANQQVNSIVIAH